MNEICFLQAAELVQRMKRKELSATEVMAAHLVQIERVNPAVNAIVTLLPEQAMAAAKAADDALVRGEEVGALHGLPIAHKDLVDTKGIRTTYGSPLFANHVPEQDALIVERLRQAGGIMIGKTNTPEFGAGSQTFNPVFGATHNPYDLSKTCGGSSGGAAVALASGLIPIADGSDMGGSLRNPASFCNVVGLRPSPGRVPSYPKQMGWFSLGVEGPMARTVADVALLLSAMAGFDSRSPISISESGKRFAKRLDRDFRGVNIGWSEDFGGLPVDGRVTAVINSQRPTFEALGCTVTETEPDFTDAFDIFKTLRAWAFAIKFAPLLQEHREQLKETIIWNSEAGMELTAVQLGEAETKRTALYHRVRQFMETHEFMIFPVSQVPPFALSQEYITEINGTPMETYIDWMQSCCIISTLGLPAISVPCGFTAEGLPIGVQIVGRHQDDFGVLQLAYAFEQATQFGKQRPSRLPHPESDL
ncbi:MAG: amidase [Chloroflexi bacterium]|nr:amidase [Chloroflexota bacterium]